MGKSGLPDIYTRSPRAAGPRAEGVRQTMSAHVTTIMCHLFIDHKLMYVTNNSSKHKPTSTTIPYSLG